jgi:hypothetical protein
MNQIEERIEKSIESDSKLKHKIINASKNCEQIYWSSDDVPKQLKDILFQRGTEKCLVFIPPKVSYSGQECSEWEYPLYLLSEHLHMAAEYCKFGQFWVGIPTKLKLQ